MAGGLALGSLDQAPSSAPPPLETCLATAKPKGRWALPPLLREVSGLALGEDGRLWVHNDEAGVIGAFDPTTGKSLGGYRLGPRLPRDDFEGIAVAGPRLFLVASGGVIYSTAVPARTKVEGVLPFETIDTGVGKFCEVEGLSYDPTARVLLLACKTARVKALEHQVAVFRWSIEKRALATPDRVLVPVRELAKGRPGKGFHPSTIDRDPRTGRWLLVSSADHAFAVVDPGEGGGGGPSAGDRHRSDRPPSPPARGGRDRQERRALRQRRGDPATRDRDHLCLSLGVAGWFSER